MEENFHKLIIDDTEYETRLTKNYLRRKPYVKADPKKIKAFIPGNIPDIFVKAGDSVKKGQALFILEAMKMKNEFLAPMDGTIKEIHMELGKNVSKNQLLLELE